MAEFFNRQWRLPNEENKNKQSNYSMDFDGSDDYINAGDSDSFSFGNGTTDSPFSVSFWTKLNSVSGTQPFLSKDTGSPNREWAISIFSDSTNRVRIFLKNQGGDSQQSIDSSTALTIDVWYHITTTYDGRGGSNAADGLNIYINGILDTPNNITYGTYTAMSNTSAPVYIGKYSSSQINGQIDAVSIFNYALSSSQITTLYGSSSTGIGNPMSLSPKPVAYYPLGDQDVYNSADYLVPNASLQDYVFDFDAGSSQYISTTASISGFTSFTVSAWANAETLTTADTLVGQWRNNNTSNSAFLMYLVSNTMHFYIGSGSSAILAGGDTTLSTGQWYHFCATWDGTTTKLYINGVQESTTGSASSMNTTTVDLLIGAYNNSAGTGVETAKTWNGKISNTQIFNTALPATGSNSIETLYNNGSPLTSMSGFSSLQGWWKLNATATFDGSNWSIPDDSSNSNTGTSNGMSQSALQQSDLQYISGFSPYALQLDGTSNYIDCGATVQQPTTNYSVSCWVKLDSLVLSGLVGNFKTGSTPQVGFALTLSSGLNFQFWADGSANSSGGAVTGTSSPNSSTWYNVVGTYDGSLVKIYVNNVLENSVSYSATPNATDQNLVIGRWYGNYSGYYTAGSMSNVSVWNTALTSAQVTELYNSGVPSNLNNHSAVSSLVSWWLLGSNSSFNNTVWTVLDEKGTNDGLSSTNMSEVDIVNGVGYTSNGVSSGMSDNVVGDAPYSTANSLSVNMDVLDRTTDIPS